MPAGAGSTGLVRQMAAHLLTALGVWVGVVVLASVAGIIRLRDIRYAPTTGLLRFSEPFWRFLVAVLVGELLILWGSHSGWPSGAFAGWCSKVLTTGFGIVAVFFGVMSAIALLNDSDPWEYLPGGPPFALREFASKHPHLRIETRGFGGTLVAVRNGASPRVILSEQELQNAALFWEEFTDASEQVRLGGPPPFPRSKCWARIRISRPDYNALSDEDLDNDVAPPEVRTVIYVFSTRSARTREVAQPFLDWAKRVGQEPTIYGNHSAMDVTTGGKTWSIRMFGTRSGVDEIHVAYADARAPASAKKK